jgi:hypothetical protein
VPTRPHVLSADLQRPGNDEQQARSALALSTKRGLAAKGQLQILAHVHVRARARETAQRKQASKGSPCASGSARNLPHDVAGLGEGNQLHRALELLQSASGKDLENRHPAGAARIW